MESSNFSFHMIDFRLKKLCEHIQERLKNLGETDSKVLIVIHNSIDEALRYQVINMSSVTSLKKLLTKLQVLCLLIRKA